MAFQNKITVFEHRDFKGISKVFTEHDCNSGGVISLRSKAFGGMISSLEVVGQPWVLYNCNPKTVIHPHKSTFVVFEEGRYTNIAINKIEDQANYLLFIDDDLVNPEITLYADLYQQGSKIKTDSVVNLKFTSFYRSKSSYVTRGAWLLYSDNSESGDVILVRTGHLENKHDGNKHFGRDVCYARPLRAGNAEIRSEVIWADCKEVVNSTVIDTFVGVNKDAIEHSFNTVRTKEYQSQMTNTFMFGSNTRIKVGASFSVNLLGASGTSELSVTQSFDVQKGSNETTTNTSTYTIEFPLVISPYTKLTARVIRKEVDITVPVKLTIVHSKSHNSIEMATYKSKGGVSIHVEYESEVLPRPEKKDD
ncbi:putative beta/gamma crystallin domain-containing protein [Namao virus]|nr:putative beta/gamma crystallin domain-containing protein [Namao virus]